MKRFLPLAALLTVLGAAWPSVSYAQYHGHGHAVVVAPYYPYPYSSFAFQWGWPYGGYPYPYPYYGYSVDPGGALKLEVKPRQAEVYVDGYYAGTVDNFDGTFQRLRTTPGEHEISLYLDGYRAVHQKLYLQPNVTTKVKYDMEKLAAGEQPEPRPQPANPPPDAGQDPNQPPYQPPYQQPPNQPRGQYPPPRQQPPPQGSPRGREVRPEVNAYGTLAVRVQPGGAEILVDNERWSGPEGQERMFIELAEGRHTVEIRKDGFRTYVTEVDVRRGETAALNVSLRSQEEK